MFIEPKSLQKSHYFLRIILILHLMLPVEFFSPTKALAAELDSLDPATAQKMNLDRVEATVANAQFNFEKISNVKTALDLVNKSNASLLSAGERGRRILDQAAKLRNVAYIKQRFSDCLGRDISDPKLRDTMLAVGKQIVNGAIAADANGLYDCVQEKNGLLSLQDFKTSLVIKMDQLNRKKFREDLFLESMKDLGAAYTNIQVKLRSPGSPNTADSLLKKLTFDLCPSADTCPKNVSTLIRSAAEKQIAELKSARVIDRDGNITGAETTEHAAARLKSSLADAYNAIYRLPDGKLQEADFLGLRGDLQLKSLAYKLRAPATVAGKNSSISLSEQNKKRQEWLSSGAALNENPEAKARVAEFQSIQSSVANDPIVQILERSNYDGLKDAFELGNPSITADPTGPNQFSFRLDLKDSEGNSLAATATQLRNLTPQNVAAAKTEALNRLKNGSESLRKLVMDRNGKFIDDSAFQLPGTDTIDEQLKELITTNPVATGRLLLKNPENVDMICRLLKDIANDKMWGQKLDDALLYASVAALAVPVVGWGGGLIGMTARVTSIARVATASAAAVDIGTLTTSGARAVASVNRQSLLNAACQSQSDDGRACREAKENLDSTIQNLSASGLSVLGLGLGAGLAKSGLNSGMTPAVLKAQSAALRRGMSKLSDAQRAEIMKYLTREQFEEVMGFLKPDQVEPFLAAIAKAGFNEDRANEIKRIIQEFKAACSLG